MKKLLLIFCLLSVLIISAQNTFTATPTRLIPENNIVDFPGKSRTEIYKSLKSWIAKTYTNPDFVTKSDVPNEYLRINGLWNIMSKGPLGKSALGVSYTLTFDIKDQKLRYNIDKIGGVGNFSYYNCFKGNGDRRQTKEVINYLNDIEVYAEIFMNEMIANIHQKEDW
ncbi:DUF4468 domain-containing protein [Chryseobacterium sp. MP_3.2]|uniref:DUF4468 domain-containing protein n=1 Tax=Chryseobacterium sp. MP_3.2 TaxID=3071712 RepID=UPI002DFE5851|nr:hypothetical protein [Chryseobacterium sp. MP_3.2]